MSASLVGSEMCIRDRCWGGGLIGLGSGPMSNFANNVRRPCVGQRLTCNDCLLYTSDAADDM
eukprot:1048549-Alexandrium_andersonii.AAC.1